MPKCNIDFVVLVLYVRDISIDLYKYDIRVLYVRDISLNLE